MPIPTPISDAHQIPPVLKGAVELTFFKATTGERSDASAPILKVVSLGKDVVTKEYLAGFEQWCAPLSMTLPGTAPLSMRCVPLPAVGDGDIDTFFQGTVPAFKAVGDTSGIDWTAGIYSPATDTGYLYLAPDPDDEKHVNSIGLVLVVSPSGVLLRAAWCKTASSTTVYSGGIWKIENQPQSDLTWTFNGKGNATAPIPPPKLPPGMSWYSLAEG
jgi:hypothetical protein